MLRCLKLKNKFAFEVRIQLLSVVSPAMNKPFGFGLPLAQLEYWTYVPSNHFIWVSTADKKHKPQHRETATKTQELLHSKPPEEQNTDRFPR